MISIAGKRKGELVLALLKAALVAAVLMHVALFAITAIYRLSNPFGLEWMEQFATQHALSMLRGHAVYSAPSMEATSTVYTPGLALVIMIAIKLGLPAMQTGRVISIVAIGIACFVLYRTVRREGGTPTISWLGIGIFLAGYMAANRVYDMARVDSSAIALLAGGLYLVTRREKWSRATLVGVLLLIAATYVKQNVGLVIVLGLGALCLSDRRKGLLALGGYFLGIGALALLLDALTGGWFHRWAWDIGSSQPLWMSDPFAIAHISWGSMIGAIIFYELPRGVPALFLLGVLALVGYQLWVRLSARPRWLQAARAAEGPLPAPPPPALADLTLAGSCVAAFLAALGPRLKVGGSINNWALVFYFVGLCSGLLLAQARRARRLVSPRVAALLYAAVLIYATYGLVRRAYDPLSGRAEPRGQYHAARYRELVQKIGAPVLAPQLSVVTELSGGGPQIMGVSLLDLVWSGRRLPPDFYPKRDRRHWKAIVMPAGCAKWPPFRGALDSQYVPVTPIKLPYFQAGGEVAHFWVWLPRPERLQPPSVTLDFELASRAPGGLSLRFEQSTYKGWVSRGAAFGRPLAESARVPGQLPVAGFEGKQLANSFASNDAATGVLLSRPFVLRGNTIRFLVGGASDPGIAAFELLFNEKVVRSASGQQSEQLARKAWDVADLVGRIVRLRIRDSGGGPYGHILVDDITITDEPRQPGEKPWAGGYRGWTAQGFAFGHVPARGALPGQLAVSSFLGERLINSFYGGDDATGTLTSERFVLHGNVITFLVGGSRASAAFELLVDDKVVLSARGQDSENLRRVSWDVTPWQGKWVRLRANDWGGGPWGHILVDDIVIVQRPEALPYWGDARVHAHSGLCTIPPWVGRGIYPLSF
ncbi:MAG: hypothetical protein KC503_18930 [Myxococcales bacterium]|nr:hypothetical protein [Myxococcales bacterium]